MHWHPKTVVKLIHLYREHDILWNYKNPNFFNKNLKNLAWNELSQEMEIPKNMLKMKVDSLKAQLRREKAKMLNIQKQGLEFISSWYGFEHLTFLLGKKWRHISSSSEDTNETHDTQMSETQDPLVPQTSSDIQPIEQVPEPKIKNGNTEDRQMTSEDIDNGMRTPEDTNGTRKSTGTGNRTSESVYSILAGSDIPSTSDSVKNTSAKLATDSSPANADQIYADFIATKFRMYSQRTKNVLQYKISNLLFQADLGAFDDDQSNTIRKPKYRASRTASRKSRANKSQSRAPSLKSKRARNNSSEDPLSMETKLEENSDLDDPFFDDD